MHDQVTALAAGAVNGGRAGDEGPRYPRAAISGAVLRAARAAAGESRELFAARAGVSVEVAAGAEDGSCPAWALPYELYEAIEAAVGAGNPGLGEVFAAAACCDLFVTGLLKGDADAEDGALATLQAEYRDLAWSLLTWAVTGVLDRAAGEFLTVPSSAPLLPLEAVSELAGLYVTVLIDGCDGCGDGAAVQAARELPRGELAVTLAARQ
jgi:transcriptional regulator with XRE-family HTH domain